MKVKSELDPQAGEHVIVRASIGKILVTTRHHKHGEPIGARGQTGGHGQAPYGEPVEVARDREHFAKSDAQLHEDVARGAPTFHDGRRLAATPGDPTLTFRYADDGSVARF